MAEVIDIKNLKEAIPHILQFHPRHLWLDYDEEADALYISFKMPQQANDSRMEDNFIYHYRDNELVGVTIMNASRQLVT